MATAAISAATSTRHGQIVRAADEPGYFGVLLPTGKSCEDSWVAASAMIPLTQRLRLLVALRPGLQTPTVAARMPATFDRLSNGRLLVNVVTGGDPAELRGDGLFYDHAERYEVTDEFSTVWRDLMAGEKVSFDGEHIVIEAGKLLYPAAQKPYPPLYFGGSSDAGAQVAADHVDLYFDLGRAAEGRSAESRQGARDRRRERSNVFPRIRLHVIVRETAAEAWAAADVLISKLDDAAIAKAQRAFANFDSVGQRRIAALHGGGRRCR